MGKNWTIKETKFKIIKREIYPPPDDESLVIVTPDQNKILVVGNFVDGPTNHTIMLDGIRAGQEGELIISVREVEKEDYNQLIMSEGPISYKIDASFIDNTPSRTKIKHISHTDQIQFERSIVLPSPNN